jgi:uncharacterized cysteine cluster protein YcgN (CxxCxxCC family)
MPRHSSRIEAGLETRNQPNDGTRARAGADQGTETDATRDATADPKPFWEVKPLEALDQAEWESLCDRCGRCCMVKLEDEDTGHIHATDIACKLFDAGACACSSYATRRKKVRDCIKLTPRSVRAIRWLPATCAYRMVSEGRPLEPWHPLISGSAETVHAAGISVRGRIGGTERTVALEDYPRHIVEWGV